MSQLKDQQKQPGRPKLSEESTVFIGLKVPFSTKLGLEQAADSLGFAKTSDLLRLIVTEYLRQFEGAN